MSVLTVEKLKELGYNVSQNINQNAVDKAEFDVIECYFKKLYNTVPDFEDANNVTMQCLACLTFLLLSRRNVRVSRFNSVRKKNEYSDSVDYKAATEEYRETAARYLSILRETCDNPSAEVSDICKIYFKTIFFYD